MAIIQLAEPFKSFRGRDQKPGGQVLYPALRRNISRSFVQPANPNTGFQSDIRSLFTSLSQEYSLVTDAENAGWIELAKNLTHKDLDGNNVVVQPKAAFISINFWNVILGNAITHTAPTYATVPGILVASALKRTSADDGWQFTYTWDGANTQIVVKSTPPLPGLRRQPRLNDYRFASEPPDTAVKAITSAGGTITILDTDSRFTYATGDRIALKLQVIEDNGIPEQTFFLQSLVAAP